MNIKYPFSLFWILCTLLVVALVVATILREEKPLGHEVTIQYIFIEDSIVQIEEEEPYTCDKDAECLEIARAIYWEARGEPLEGQIAVAHVIMNRVKAPYWKGDIVSVIHTKCHFEYLCIKGLTNRTKNKVAWERSKSVAEGVLLGYYEDNTFGANHYLAKNKLTRLPKWANVYKETVTIGNHTFYKRER